MRDLGDDREAHPRVAGAHGHARIETAAEVGTVDSSVAVVVDTVGAQHVVALAVLVRAGSDQILDRHALCEFGHLHHFGAAWAANASAPPRTLARRDPRPLTVHVVAVDLPVAVVVHEVRAHAVRLLRGPRRLALGLVVAVGVRAIDHAVAVVVDTVRAIRLCVASGGGCLRCGRWCRFRFRRTTRRVRGAVRVVAVHYAVGVVVFAVAAVQLLVRLLFSFGLRVGAVSRHERQRKRGERQRDPEGRPFRCHASCLVKLGSRLPSRRPALHASHSQTRGPSPQTVTSGLWLQSQSMQSTKPSVSSSSPLLHASSISAGVSPTLSWQARRVA